MKSCSRRWRTAARCSTSRTGSRCSAVRCAATSRRSRRADRRNSVGRIVRSRFITSWRRVAACVLLLVAARAGFQRASAQVIATGQDVVPVFEGWEQNADGTFNLVFGYFNRNWEEEVDIPIGADNTIEPGGADQGQPTHFLPRRNRFLFRVRVPGDFGKKEIVWTLTTRGKTTRAYGTLKPDYFMDDIVIMNNSGAGGAGGGNPDTIGNK